MVGLGRAVGAGADLVIFGIVVTAGTELPLEKERTYCLEQSRSVTLASPARRMELRQNRVAEVC
jgi:hypothetical protein